MTESCQEAYRIENQEHQQQVHQHQVHLTSRSESIEITDHDSTRDNTGSEKHLGDIVSKAHRINARENLWLTVLFSLMGAAQLLVWHALVSTMMALEQYIYPGTSLQYILAVCLHVPALIVTIVSVRWIDGLNVRGAYLCTAANFVVFLVFPAIPQWIRTPDGAINDSRTTAGIVVLCLITVVMGVNVGYMHTYGYSFASILPNRCYTGFVSTGNAIAGAYSFLVFLLGSEVLFPAKTTTAQLSCVWLLFLCGGLVSAAQGILFFHASRKAWFIEAVTAAKTSSLPQSVPECAVEFADVAPPSSSHLRSFHEVWRITKQCWVQTLNGGITLAATLLVFPRISPYRWNQSYLLTTLLIGTFQIADLLSRLASAAGWFGFIKPSRRTITWITYFRLIFGTPLMILPALGFFESAPVLGKPAFQFFLMVLFTGTGGWCVSFAALYNAESVSDPTEKEIAAEVFCIGILTFVTTAVCATELLSQTIGL